MRIDLSGPYKVTVVSFPYVNPLGTWDYDANIYIQTFVHKALANTREIFLKNFLAIFKRILQNLK